MQKTFFEVFRTLDLDNRIMRQFDEVTVERVAATRSRSLLKVYLTSDHIIPKESVFKVEKTLGKLLFSKQNPGKVKIYETFHLSDAYTPKTLFEEYRSSILLELAMAGMACRVLFEQADISFLSDDEMHLDVEDYGYLEGRQDELKRILEKIFLERCNLPVKVTFSFHTPKEEEDPDAYEALPFVRRGDVIRKTGEDEAYEEPGEELGDMYREEHMEEYEAKIARMREKAAGDLLSEETDKDSAGGQKEAGADKEKPVKHLTLEARAGRKRGAKKDKNMQEKQIPQNPDVIYGRDFEPEEYTPIESILSDLPDVSIRGQIIKVDERALKDGERCILLCDLTDFTDTLRFKLFLKLEEAPGIRERLKEGKFVSVKGPVSYDTFDKELSLSHVRGVKAIPDFRTVRKDDEKKKRVELHCHTKMSELDGVSDVKDIVKRAYEWGHPAIAITDHGVVSAFPEANHAWEKLYENYKAQCEEQGIRPDRQKFFKVIYGTEGYLVDDEVSIVNGDRGQDLKGEFVVFDIETTGLSPVKNRIIEIGAAKVVDGKITDHFSEFINPGVPIPYNIVKLTHITDKMVGDADPVEKVLPRFLEFCKGAVLVAHNASFDMSFIIENAKRLSLPCDFTWADTMQMARILLNDMKRHRLDAVCKKLGIELLSHHRAVDDAEATAKIFVRFLSMLSERGIDTLSGLNELGESFRGEIVKRLFMYHVVLLAKNNTGRENLYRIITESHLTYFNGKPRIPKSLIMKYREGILVGSACERGELYRALLEGVSEERLSSILGFYDYLEIQPVSNNHFMIASDKEDYEGIRSEEDIIAINKRIVELGEEWGKPVVATSDVHFLDPEDEIYRRIIMAGRNMVSEDDNDLPLFLRTTEEMLREFDYLGDRKAREVVIDNTRKIADMIDSISPVRPDKCPPVIPHSDETLRRICYDRAHELYGEELPEVVTARLEKELNSIISNGFAVMYIIAQKLVWKSVEDGYLVGSRGSVGSSLAAFMAGITEVNSLGAHYRCPQCHYTDFDSEEIRAHVGNAGCDLPDKRCPVCGEMLVKDGFDIPFETFLGFKGNKEPDIDLNFSGEYQSKAHKYTEVIFGAGQTYRAGTISTLADKTAYGYVKHYFEEQGIHKRPAEIDRITAGCVGVRRTTGQHPGGIVVLPMGEDINSFTPVQHPPQDEGIIATHFEYHSIDHNLLKLDILGHDDPTMIRMLQDLTGVDPTSIPLDDKRVMSLFQNTAALGIRPEQIDGVMTGSLGIPEFGTDFVIKMLLTTKPKNFSDLIRISGLGHGTDVWLGNAETLIKEGVADLSHCICCRDDIMIYLISCGVEPSLSFTIMESVRKGKGLKPEWEEEMIRNGVPDWYITSCKKIKYMFPKAHAAAYVMMAWRIGYFKINYPLAYYAAFYTIRSKAFDYEAMCISYDMMLGRMNELKEMENPSPKDENMLKDMRIVQEMYERGFSFMPIDLEKVHARHFQVFGDKIMPSLTAIDGVAEAAADAIVEAVKDGPFLSKDDFRERTHVSRTITDTFDRLGLLGDIPDSNQISLFDLLSIQ
ncbi:MAG: PolC-type DNA polymerase III [Lachnospiraceae bacterium]|nr:PolC-type DNA polymerase III [Lachnospiraceae bacterium]